MIGYLSGTPMITPTSTLMIVGGVGYSILITSSTRERLAQQEMASVFVYPQIKEDSFDLYAFLTEAEKELFKKLINVDGIGPKTALSIMDRGVSAVIAAVKTADVSFFSSISRVGKKSAQKIIIELANKFGGEEELDLTEPTGPAKDVAAALIALGFSETESYKVLKSIPVTELKLEEAIKLAIRTLTAP
ncbi:Holliday junction branch migration protein RuvA [Candidatus Woesebacteria bacterium]|nr:Holliday junction branch migration protein RuvA [Candidatus Woesebacteria bacterium]